MNILNKKIKCTFLTDIKVKDCMITLYGGSYYMLSNDECLACTSIPLAASKRGYKYSICIGYPSQTFDYVLKNWRIRDIKLLRKLNHEL